MKSTLLTTLLFGLILTAGTTMPIHADDVVITAMDPISDYDEPKISSEEVTEKLEARYWDTPFVRSEEREESRREDIAIRNLDEDAQRDIYCLTEAMYFESLGEPEKGKIAVANVIMNRAKWTPSDNNRNKHHYEFSKSICDVVNFKAPKIVYKKRGKVRKVMVCAFSYRCERAFHRKLARVQKKPVWNEIKTLATQTYLSYNSDENVDPTNGATFYHATWMRQYPSWSRQYKRTTKIGLHQFYKIE